jgi:metal iron transporter
MNCPIRTDPAPDEGHNQNPSDLANEINTNNTLNHRRNSTHERNGRIHLHDGSHDSIEEGQLQDTQEPGQRSDKKAGASTIEEVVPGRSPALSSTNIGAGRGGLNPGSKLNNGLHKLKKAVLKYFRFMGPGLMVSVAYIDPGMRFSPLKSKKNHT